MPQLLHLILVSVVLHRISIFFSCSFRLPRENFFAIPIPIRKQRHTLHVCLSVCVCVLYLIIAKSGRVYKSLAVIIFKRAQLALCLRWSRGLLCCSGFLFFFFVVVLRERSNLCVFVRRYKVLSDSEKLTQISGAEDNKHVKLDNVLRD